MALGITLGFSVALFVGTFVWAVDGEGCRPLCFFDAWQTGTCLPSREYAAELVAKYQQGVWGEVASHLSYCEGLGHVNCTTGEHCEVDEGYGHCTASRAWATTKMSAPSSEGGLDFGSNRCGLLGQLLVGSTNCMPLNQSDCENGTASTIGEQCAWDEIRGRCDVPRNAIMRHLRQHYRSELTRVSLRRERCAAQRSSSACSGECEWQGDTILPQRRLEEAVLSGRKLDDMPVAGHCMLRTVDAILSVVGEDCPLRTIIHRHSDCRTSTSAEACQLRGRDSGMPECVWFNATMGCKAYPMALEFEIMELVGINNADIHSRLRAVLDVCASEADETSCNARCGDAPTQGIARSLQPHIVLSVLVLVLNSAHALRR